MTVAPEITPRSLLIASPKYTGLTTSHQHSVRKLEAWCRQEGIETDVLDVANAPVDAAREILAAGFLSSRFERMLMVDAGIGFHHDVIKRMLAVSNEGKDFVACAAPLRRYRVDRACERAAEGLEKPERFAADFVVTFHPDAMGAGTLKMQSLGGQACARLSRIGGAMLLLTRKPFEAVYDACPQLKHNAGFSYFLPAIFDDERHGEDTAFCRRYADAGGEMWLMLDAPLTHEGHAIFEGNLASMFG